MHHRAEARAGASHVKAFLLDVLWVANWLLLAVVIYGGVLVALEAFL